MAIQPNGTAPYAPPKAIQDLILNYRERDMRKPWTTDVLMQAGVSESLAPRTLQALKLLDIIDGEGNPTPQFEALVRAPEGEFKQGLGDLFCAVYSDVFAFADPATHDISRIRDAFRPYSPRGQQERMITLFVGLLEFAGLDVSAAKASMRPKKEGKASPRKPSGKPKSKDKNKANRNDGSNLANNQKSSNPPAQTGSVFGIPASDLALLEEGEFDEVWSALGRLAKAKARAERSKDSGGTRAVPDKGEKP